jgi:hypothetical protein
MPGRPGLPSRAETAVYASDTHLQASGALLFGRSYRGCRGGDASLDPRNSALGFIGSYPVPFQDG